MTCQLRTEYKENRKSSSSNFTNTVVENPNQHERNTSNYSHMNKIYLQNSKKFLINASFKQKKTLWPPSQSVNEKKLTLFLLRGCLNSSCTFFGSLLFLLGLLTKEIHIIVIVILSSLKTNIQIPPINNNTYRFYKANLNKFKATIESKSPT